MRRALRRAAIALLVGALIVSAGLLLAQDQTTIQVKSEVSAEDPRDPAYVAALVGAALTRGNRYEVLTNGDRIFPAMLGAIDKAQHRAELRNLRV